MKTLTTIKTCDEQEFIQHSRVMAKLIDQKRELPEQSYIMFGDPADLLRLLRPKNRFLFRVIKDHPGSIDAIAERLQRPRNAVQRDINELKRLGIVEIERCSAPHDACIEQVHLTALQFKLEADLI